MEKTLLYTTKNEVLERMMLKNASYYDPVVLRAIEKYLGQTSPYNQALNFVNALSPAFGSHQKESYIAIFKEYMEIEGGIEAHSPNYISHIDHVIQEFLIGYNILHTNEYVLEQLHYQETKEVKDSDYNNLIFSWMIGALFHDTGYDVEKYAEEEKFRERKNEYWSFLTKRPVVTERLQLSEGSGIEEIIEEHLLRPFNERFGTNYNYPQFISIFRNGDKYDHAFISSLKYLEHLHRLERETGGNYLSWPPNYDAVFSMLLHNLKYKDIQIRLEFSEQSGMLPYLLIVCDEIEYWERKRFFGGGKQIDSSVELMNASFKGKYSYFIVNHIVSNKIMMSHKKKLFEDIIDGIEKYPVEIVYSELMDKIDYDIATKVSRSNKRESIVYLFEGKFRNFAEISTDEVVKILKLSRTSKRLREKLVNIENADKSLIQTGSYKVIVEHRINDKQFLVTEFLL